MKLKNFVLVQPAEREEEPIVEEIGQEITQNSIMQALELCYDELRCHMTLQDDITIIMGNSQKSFTLETLICKALQIELNI